MTRRKARRLRVRRNAGRRSASLDGAGIMFWVGEPNLFVEPLEPDIRFRFGYWPTGTAHIISPE